MKRRVLGEHPSILPLNIARSSACVRTRSEILRILVEFNAMVGDGRLELKFGIPKGEVDVSEVLGGYFA